MMKSTDFAKNLTSFFGNYLPGVKNLSGNTILSYRDAFRLLLIFCRDILGHVDIATTDIYARADTESKRKELERAYPDITPDVLPDWNRDENLLGFLNSL